ncbi:MAG: hypothetical protein WAM14_03935 [Candidatus Nitrosopolaris sp.]
MSQIFRYRIDPSILNIAYLNFNNLRLQEVKANIAKVIDYLMTLYRNHKGVIHTTSYEQLNFIKENISQTNKRRLLVTDSQIQRDEVIAEHVNSTVSYFTIITYRP